MSVKTIKDQDLRRMGDREGLVLQGCGGDPTECVNGINDILTKEGILLENTRFSECYSFEHEGATCILFLFSEDVKLNPGKLAMWRLRSHEVFGSTWLSDYVPNQLGGFLSEEQEVKSPKPDCPLIGQDGNIFNLMGIASRTLERNGLADQASEMCSRITASGNYYEALGIIGEYVNITSSEQAEDMSEEMEMQI